ncbi:hypothetical protein niasHT_025006 [Heterodera trifolii]|uniref:Uncharacterized protein n=1 Tax=Heterodera trifolii TaxID=157864 RepID=A0ABD2KT28_9BILA
MEVDGPQQSQDGASSALNNVSASELAQTVRELATLFGIAAHPNPLVMLRAIEKRVVDIKKALNGGVGAPKNPLNVVPLELLATGTPPSGSRSFDNALRVLRLLHTARMRELQTRINATIVEVQKVTANPRADLSLGRIGR